MKALSDIFQDTRPYAVEDTARTWSDFLFTCGVWFVALVGTLPHFSMGARILCSFIAGLVMVRLFIFYHDQLHGAIFRRSPFGKFIMSCYGILILNPPNVWKRSHNYHHQNNAQIITAGIGSFPVMTVEQYQTADLSQKILYLLARNPFTILFGYFFLFIVGMCLKSFLTDPKRHWDSLLALVLHFSLWALLIPFGWDVAVLSLGLPIFVACALGGYLFYIQHNFPDVKLLPRTEWDYYYAALHSSSFMEGSWLTHWFTGNIGYHHVHHLNSLIPFYRLPEVMEAIPELQNPGRTSLRPRDIMRCVRLKLWDPESDSMVGFPENRVFFPLIPQFRN